MYEDMTFEYILKRMLSRVPAGIDKREGSVIYDALAPAAAELSQMYIELIYVIKESFADTASRKYLILRANERGLKPKIATHTVAKGCFNKDISIGNRFNMDRYNFVVTEKMPVEGHFFKLKCETAGKAPNYCIGKITPIEYINGLTSAEILEILILGEDEEATEDFRKRYMNSFNGETFGGNRAEYTEKINDIQGVGGVKIYRA